MSALKLTLSDSGAALNLKPGFLIKRSHRKLESLIQSVRHDGQDKRQVVQFLSANRSQDKSMLPVSFELAYMQAEKSGKPTLYIDSSEDMSVMKSILTGSDIDVNTLNILTVYPVGNGDLCLLSLPRRIDAQGVDHAILEPVFATLKERFNMIIVDGNSPLHCPENIEYGLLSDGTVLVLQAELTRIPVVREIAELLHKFDIKIIGSVLNNRKLYIPQFVYKLLFRS